MKAEVDMGTGDVLLSFGDQYFNTGQANLKPKMEKILEQAMPAYSSSLFENPKVANKIQSVEIVGFASPTYKGKYVNPSKVCNLGKSSSGRTTTSTPQLQPCEVDLQLRLRQR